MIVVLRVSLLLSVTLVLSSACTRSSPSKPSAVPDGGIIVARWSGGELSLQELRHEAGRLPPGLRAEFRTNAGEEQLARSLVDKQLLLAEARRRGITETPEVQREVRELEARLAISALLAAEEKSLAPPNDAELRAYYDENPKQFTTKARARVARVLVRAPAAAPAKAKARINALRARLQKGEPVGKVAAEGDGLERTVGGEIGWLEDPNDAIHVAALALQKVGEVTPVIESGEGFQVLVLLERAEARTLSFEEARSQVAGKTAPARQRRVFDSLLAKLRSQAQVTFVAKSP